jgi:hypothetical protein
MSKKLTDRQADQDALRILQQARDSGRRELVNRKLILPSAEFADALGVSREDLNKKVAAHRLFTMELDGENYYPAFYLEPDVDRKKKLEHVSRTLGDISGWRKWQFFTTPKGSLADKTPLQALKDNAPLETVITTAIGFSER